MFIHSISIALSNVKDCQYTCPGGWVGGDEEQLIMSRLRIRLSQPNLAEVGVGAELGKNTNKQFLDKGADSYHYPRGW